MSYTKLQSSIIASTVWAEPYPTRIVWIAMLAMANRDGHVNASIPGLAHIARVTRTEAEEAISVLCAPDPDSRSKVAEGRRLEEIEGGWNIINYIAIRDSWTDDDKRAYQRKWAANKRANPKPTQNPTHSVEVVSKSVEVCRSESKRIEAPAPAPTPTPDVDKKEEKNKNRTADGATCAEFAELRAAYPQREGGQRWADAEKAYKSRIREGHTHADMLAGVQRYASYCATTGITGGRMVQQCATFLGQNKGFAEPWSVNTTAHTGRNQAVAGDFASKTYAGTPPSEFQFLQTGAA